MSEHHHFQSADSSHRAELRRSREPTMQRERATHKGRPGPAGSTTTRLIVDNQILYGHVAVKDLKLSGLPANGARSPGISGGPEVYAVLRLKTHGPGDCAVVKSGQRKHRAP